MSNAKLKALELEAEMRRRRNGASHSTEARPVKEVSLFDVERVLADIRSERLDRDRWYVPGVNLDSDDPDAHASDGSKGPNSWMW